MQAWSEGNSGIADYMLQKILGATRLRCPHMRMFHRHCSLGNEQQLSLLSSQDVRSVKSTNTMAALTPNGSGLVWLASFLK